jgi:hypothetical protein
MKRSNKDLPIVAIGNKGKLSIVSSNIEWTGIYDQSSIFRSSSFLKIHNVTLDQNSAPDYQVENE